MGRKNDLGVRNLERRCRIIGEQRSSDCRVPDFRVRAISEMRNGFGRSELEFSGHRSLSLIHI
eukprot:1044003-Alexandrium_andersonii.AAC.1